MVNTLIWGFENNKTIFNKISIEKKIDIKSWIGKKDICLYCTLEVRDLYDNTFIEKLNDLNGELITPEIYNSIYDKYLIIFINMFSRTIDGQFKNYHENLDIFNIFLNYFYNLIIRNKINIVFFSSLPHFGPDILIYAICNELNIKTVMLYQSLFPNKFFYTYNIYDFGKFSYIKQKNTERILIEEKFEKKLFYMNRIPRNKSPLRRYIGENIRILCGKRKKELNYSTSLVKYEKTKLFYKNNKKIVKNLVDLEKNFAYFPLHLQPELSTSTLGGMYSDQILALERLRKLLPLNFYIYVKENPKQTYKERNNSFYKRLGLLKNVVLINDKYNTYELLKKCKLVATITGTVGWEALSGGKPVIVFGSPWYKSLPGVFEFSSGLHIKDVLSYSIDKNQLQSSFDNLISKTRHGIVDFNYKKIYKNYVKEKNDELVENFIINEINNIKMRYEY